VVCKVALFFWLLALVGVHNTTFVFFAFTSFSLCYPGLQWYSFYKLVNLDSSHVGVEFSVLKYFLTILLIDFPTVLQVWFPARLVVVNRGIFYHALYLNFQKKKKCNSNAFSCTHLSSQNFAYSSCIICVPVLTIFCLVSLWT